MLTESFVVATCDPEKAINNTATGIHFHGFQPQPTHQSTFKKSSINVKCLAFGPTHVFAAQADKAVIHVYNRERSNLEAIVPFPERIRSIGIFGAKGGAGVLVMGTESGRLILWEVSLIIDPHSYQIADRPFSLAQGARSQHLSII